MRFEGPNCASASFVEVHARALYCAMAAGADWQASDWDLPEWDDLPEAARERWRSRSRAILDATYRHFDAVTAPSA
jgi:hypothetical protein